MVCAEAKKASAHARTADTAAHVLNTIIDLSAPKIQAVHADHTIASVQRVREDTITLTSRKELFAQQSPSDLPKVIEVMSQSFHFVQ